MRFIQLVIIGSIAVVLSGCATVKLPSNVTTRAGNASGAYIDSIDFSYTAQEPKQFGKLKLCVAETVSNRAVNLHDASNSFVGAATGNYYHITSNQTVQGGGIFKYSDPSMSTLIATGTVDGGEAAWGLTKEFIKFDLKAAVHGSDVTLKFSDISRAQQETGYATNTGFDPVGTWSGAHPKQVYATLQRVASDIRGCLK